MPTKHKPTFRDPDAFKVAQRRAVLSTLAVPSLYVIWSVLAWISAATGLSAITASAVLPLVLGILATNAFFLAAAAESIRKKKHRDNDLYAIESCVAIGWAGAYMYYSSNSGELVLGMLLTVLIHSIFRLRTTNFYRVAIFSAVIYGGVMLLTWSANPADAALWYGGFRFMLLPAILVWGIFYAQQVRDLRNELQDRNTELQTILDRVTKIAERDDLTKSYNRRYIMEALGREKSRSDRSGNPYCVCIFDLDLFKAINDQYGHLVGDQVLQSFADQVKTELRGMDIINPTEYKRSFGRFGGEEFIAVLPGTVLSGARQCAERIRANIASHQFLDEYSITVSVGVAEYSVGETVRSLLERADAALYEAKASGRDQVKAKRFDPPDHRDDSTIPNLRIIR
jgi:diguanylate cyclase (GGDEF)-like protein